MYLGGTMNYLNCYLALCITTICLGLTPLFIVELQPRIHDISVSTLGTVLRTSVTIKVMVGISIGTTLPVMTDIVLDKISNISFVDLNNTVVVLLGIIVFGASYLCLNDQYYMTYFYVSCFYFVTLITISAIFHSISRGVVATKWKMGPWLFIIPSIGMAATYAFVLLVILFPENYAFRQVLIIFRISSGLMYILLHVYWFYSLWRHYESNQRFGLDEMKEIAYMVGGILFLVFLGSVFSITDNRVNFLNTDERFLVIYYTVLIICCLIMTVLPGRLLRKLSEINESVLQMKREFVRYLSHEIRSPLNVSHAGLEILKAELEVMGASLAILNLVDDIFSASNAAIEILNDSLHYEHIDSGTFKLELAVTPLLNVFAGRLEAYKYMATKKGINLRIEDLVQASEYYHGDDADAEEKEGLIRQSTTAAGPASSSILVLYIDRFRVEQIIRNLLSNAIKFTPEGGDVTMRLTRIAARSVGRPPHYHKEATEPITKLLQEDNSLDKTCAGYLRFEVVDSGAGIALENQPKMFNEFMQFNRNTLQGGGGSGLGLWICKNLATLHGGNLDFHSDGEGLGSTFAVELPIYSRTTADRFEAPDIESAESVAPSSGPQARRPQPRPRATNVVQVLPASHTSEEGTSNGDTTIEIAAKKKLTVLIVDDSSANRKIVRRMLESSVNKAVLGDVSILEADDGSTALDVLRSETDAGRAAAAVDLVLMDYVMVRMNGPEAARRMRADLGYRGVVIGITGNALPEDLDTFRAHGANLVLTKPLTNDKLINAIRETNCLDMRRIDMV